MNELVIILAAVNYYVLIIFAPLLILTGIAGFVLPANKSLTSGAGAYNIFHIVFGLAGIMIATHHYDYIRVFNIGFGLIDLYQAGASYLHIFPEKYFRWKRADDILHVVIGAGLVAVGIFGN
ncbi:MAG: hypothetical protein ABJB40_03500 [Acidobacteriota bacterium]